MRDWVEKYLIPALFSIVTAVFGIIVKCICTKIKQQQQKQDALDTGMQALLDDRITQVYHSCMNTGYCPVYLLKSVLKLYNSYNVLCPRDESIMQLVDELKHMPKQRGELTTENTEGL